jgi:hypothetical protein
LCWFQIWNFSSCVHGFDFGPIFVLGGFPFGFFTRALRPDPHHSSCARFSCRFPSFRRLPKCAATFVVCSHPVCAARVDWVLVAVFFSHWFLRCCRCLFFSSTFALCEDRLRLESPRRRFFRLVFFFPARFRFFVLGVTLGHGSRRAVSPRFLRRQPRVPRCLVSD